MAVLARSLLGQSGLFLHVLASREWHSSKKMKTLLYLHFSFFLNVLLCFKSHTILWAEIHKAFVKKHNLWLIIAFLKKSLTMVREIYHDEFFMNVSDRSVLQKSKRLMTSLQFVIRPLISKLLKSKWYP